MNFPRGTVDPLFLAFQSALAGRHHTPRLARTIAIATFAVGAACTTWRPMPVPAPGATSAEVAENARVILKDGTSMELHNVVVRGDSLVGMNASKPNERVAVAIANVDRLDVKKVSAGKTAGLFGGLALGALILATIAISTLIILVVTAAK